MGLFFIFGFIGSHTPYAEVSVEGGFTKDFRTADKKRLFDSPDNLFGKEGLAGIGGWAHRVTASALSTGIAIEQLFPGELFSFGDAIVFTLLQVFQQW